MPDKKITFDHGKKFDLQLSAALIEERKLGRIFEDCQIEKIELKTESFLWERTGNICIEYECNGEPSGIAATRADMWVHQLKRASDGATVAYLMFPVSRLKELARIALRQGRGRIGGDGRRMKMALIPLADILQDETKKETTQ
jgi:hypothetical protein